jgi:hypothetical protein
MLRYLLALARGGFPPDADAAPGGAPAVAAFSGGALPVGSPKKHDLAPRRRRTLPGPFGAALVAGVIG